MKRTLILLYGVACYAVFFATFLYAIGFIGNLWVPKGMDSAPTAPLATALLIDLGLLALFAVQHSVMARPAFKRAWTRLIPESAERSTYTLFSSLALILLFWLWILPVILGQPFLRLYLLAEHGDCPRVANMLENTRTTFTTALVRFLAWNMPFHVEHHVYPNVPFHRLPALHDLMQDRLQVTSQGYAAFTRDYLARRQTSARR